MKCPLKEDNFGRMPDCQPDCAWLVNGVCAVAARYYDVDANDDLPPENDISAKSVDANDGKAPLEPAPLLRDYDEFLSESCNQVADQREHAEMPLTSKWQSNDAQSDSREKLDDRWYAHGGVMQLTRENVEKLRGIVMPYHNGEKLAKLMGKQFYQLIYDEPHDSREKLEADVRDFFGAEPTCEVIMRWLDRQAAITTNQLTSKSDVSKPEEITENATSKSDMRDFGDSREKLEADALSFANGFIRKHNGAISWNDELYRGIVELLDRQAAIAEREIEKKWSSFSDSVDGHIAELTNQLESAHAKNRALKAHIAKMQEGRHGWHIKGKELQDQVDSLKRKLEAATDANTDYRDEWHRVCAERERLAREIGTLRAERDRYRDLCGKLLDAADEMRRVRDQFDAFTEVD